MAVFGGSMYNLGSFAGPSVDSMGVPVNTFTDINGVQNGQPGFDPTTATSNDGAATLYSSAAGAAQGGIAMATAAGPGGVITDIASGIGGVLGSRFGPLGSAVGATVPQLLGSFFQPSGAPGGGRRRGQHLNKSTYVTRKGGTLTLVPKHSKLVTNRRRNAGNAKAVRRSLGRLAMFDHLAKKVEAEMQRVARRHHRSSPRAAPRGGHRPGCRCFRCRR